ETGLEMQGHHSPRALAGGGEDDDDDDGDRSDAQRSQSVQPPPSCRRRWKSPTSVCQCTLRPRLVATHQEGIMAEPIVFISRWRIREGKRAEFEAMYAQGVESIGSSKPRTALFAAYLEEAGEELRIVHAVPDAAAMTDQ